MILNLDIIYYMRIYLIVLLDQLNQFIGYGSDVGVCGGDPDVGVCGGDPDGV